MKAKCDELLSNFAFGFILRRYMKVIGMGASEYGRDRFNLFDAAVVLLSIVEMARLQP